MEIKVASSSLRIQHFMIIPKNIGVRYHFLRDRVQKGATILDYIPSELQVANILTKSLIKGKFEMLRKKLVLVENNLLAKSEC
jgi:hypothetical protein